MSDRLHRLALPVILGLALFGASPARQALPQGYPTFRVQANLVVVDITARSTTGRLVTDLRPEELRVYEDGVLQRVVTFARESIPARSTGRVVGVVNYDRKAPAAVSAARLRNTRLTVLFFDLASMTTEDLLRAVEAAEGFVSRCTPFDLLAIATYSSQLHVAVELTNDRARLLRALGAIKPIDVGKAAPEVVEPAGKVDESAEEEAEPVEDLYVPDEVQFDTFNTDRRLAALATLARGYRELPQRKALIYFSGGMRTTGTENQARVRATIAASNRSNLTFYTVDSRGLATVVPGGDAARGAPRGIALFTGSAVEQQEAELASSRDTLVSLAHGTGGDAFLDLVDLAPVFDRVVADTRTYYVLGYVPKNKHEDGRFRRIEVKVLRPGVQLEHRPGYLAARSFRRLTALEREQQLEEVLRADRPYSDLSVLVKASSFRKDSDVSVVRLSVRLPGGELQFEEREERREAVFDFMARVADPDGSIAALARDTVEVRLPPQSVERLQRGQIFYSTSFELRPGSYALRALVRDNSNGKLGSFEQTMVVPAYEGQRLQMSSVVLGSRLADPEDRRRVRHREGGESPDAGAPAHDPLETPQGRVLPNIGNVFLNRQALYVFFQVYGAAEDPATRAPNLETNVVLIRNKAVVQENEGVVVRQWIPGSRDVAAVLMRVPLRGLRSGTYILQAHARDGVRDANAFARVPLVIN